MPVATSRPWNLIVAPLVLLLGLAASLWAWQGAARSLQARADADFERFARMAAANVKQQLRLPGGPAATPEALLLDAVDAQDSGAYRLSLIDQGPETGAAEPRLLAQTQPTQPLPAQAAPADLLRHAMAHAGRLWLLQVERAPVQAAQAPQPLALLGCGLVLSGVLAGLLATMNRLRQRAREMALSLSAEALRTARRLDAVLDSTVDGVLTLDADHRIVAANRATQGIFGVEQAQALVGRSLGSLISCDEGEADTQGWEPGSQREVTAVRADGTRFAMTLMLAAADTGEQRHLVATVRDLTEAKAADEAIAMTMQALQQATELHETMLRHAAFAIVMTDAQGRIRASNPAAARLLGRSAEALRDIADFGDLVDADELQQMAQAAGHGGQPPFAVLTHTLEGRESAELELHLQHAEARRIPVSLTLTALPSDGDADGGFLAIFYDVTERRELAAQMARLAYSDGLTGLPNRMQLERDLAHALAAADRRGHGLALLFIDLDRFKPINDRYGHAMGDRVLREVARRLQATLRTTDITARIGGDEFVVLLPALAQAGDSALVAEKLIAAVSAPMHLDGQELSVGASIGVITYPEGGRDAEELLRGADAAMYQVKQAGRNGVRVHTRPAALAEA